MIDMYGPARFLNELDTRHKRVIDASKWGKLWEVAFGHQIRLFVEVQNTSGNHETHVIPVDPWLRPLGVANLAFGSQPRTALQAIASTFGMNAKEYQKIVES
jgi:hypothetical protein